jgi:acetyltransferase EpsM
MHKINLYGASGHAKVIADIADASDLEIDSIFDDNQEITTFLGIHVKTKFISEELLALPLIISIGNNKIRHNLYKKFKLNLALPLIHPSAVVSKQAKIGKGTVVMPNAVINADTSIGENCIINTGAVIEHDCVIENAVHISPNAALAGHVNVGQGTHVGIGAGAVVTKSLPNNCTALGIPARPIKFH